MNKVRSLLNPLWVVRGTEFNRVSKNWLIMPIKKRQIALTAGLVGFPEKNMLENGNGMIYYHTGGDKNGSIENCNYNR